MTTQTDVLAVLDKTIARNRERGAAKGSPSDRELIAVRAAVAELMAANHVLIEEWARIDEGDPMPAKDWEAAEARLRAALANMGPQS